MLMAFFEPYPNSAVGYAAHNPARFWLIWITITAGAVICVASAARQAAVIAMSQQATKRPINSFPIWRRSG